MSGRPRSVKRIVEQNRKNIAAIAKELGAENHLKDDTVGAEWAKTFGLQASEKEEKSSGEETAELLTQNAENIVRLADAVGVSEHRTKGKATKAEWSKTFGFASGEDGASRQDN